MIRIRFSDSDWVDVDGKILKMSLQNDLYMNSRITHNYLAPVITEESWNGQSFPVQKNIWESYIIEFHVKELAINMLNKMQSCRNISIIDFATDETITIDTQANGGITLEAGDRYQSTGQSFTLICRSRKIKLYPGIAVLNTNKLEIIKDLITYNYYSDFAVINFVSDSEKLNYINGSGIDFTAKTTSKNAKRMLFYLMETTAVQLKKHVENIGNTSMIINPSTDNASVIEIGKCSLTLLTEGLYRCECELVISSNLKYA